jgi:stage II sporulation protein D
MAAAASLRLFLAPFQRSWTKLSFRPRLSAKQSALLLKCGLGVSCLWGMAALPVQAEVEMRVAVEDQVSSVVIGSSTVATVKNAAGQGVGQLPHGQPITIAAEGGTLKLANWQGQAFWVEPNDGGYIFIDDTWYRGRVLLVPDAGGLTAINWVELEEYLYSVLGGEMPTSWPQEALKAQAVAARSYALYRREKSQTSLYDVDGTTASQVYKGLAAEAVSTQTAVNSTRGQVLVYGNRVIEAVFHSSSGGQTENVENVWQNPLPYLRSVPDFDQDAPVFRWSETLSLEQFQQRVTGIGRLQSAVAESTSPTGRIMTMRLQGSEGSRVLTGNELRQALRLRSTLFSIAIAGDTVQINGRGYGHGIGLSQWGARALAMQGYSYQQILAHYYQGTLLSQIQVARGPSPSSLP